MFVPIRTAPRDAAYSMIIEPRREGAVIGYFADEPISERVVDTFGRCFAYIGLASRRRDGKFDADQLKVGEFIAEPGLVYRLITGHSSEAAPTRRAA
jgi:hypothetical protein